MFLLEILQEQLEKYPAKGKKLRGSVWDRLGKPCEVSDGMFDTHAVGSIKNEVQEFDKNRGGDNPSECNIPEQETAAPALAS
ncbi:hypothetical protein U1Q18_041580 [Sarracenia purpurea var. burkii]